jgi:hypothetical protein
VLGWPLTHGLSSARAQVDVKMLSRPGLVVTLRVAIVGGVSR